MIKYFGKTLTPKQMAKTVIDSVLDNANYWSEQTGTEMEGMTPKEVAEIDRHVEQQLERIRKFLKV